MSDQDYYLRLGIAQEPQTPLGRLQVLAKLTDAGVVRDASLAPEVRDALEDLAYGESIDPEGLEGLIPGLLGEYTLYFSDAGRVQALLEGLQMVSGLAFQARTDEDPGVLGLIWIHADGQTHTQERIDRGTLVATEEQVRELIGKSPAEQAELIDEMFGTAVRQALDAVGIPASDFDD